MTDQFEVQRFARDFARRLAKLERAQRRTAASPNTLNHAAIDGGDLVVKDDQGQVKYHLGTDPVTGVTAPRFEPGPVPNTPEAPDLEAREGAVHVSLSGVDVDEQPAPEDLRLVEIHMSLDEHFEVSPGTMAGSTPNPVDGVSISKAAGVWWVRVVWVTLSGQRSEPSEAVSVDIVPPVDAQDIQDTLDTAQARLDEYRDNVATPRFQALEEGLSENNDNLSDARTRLSAAESTLAPLPGRIESAERDVEAAKEAAESAEARAVEASNNASNRLTNGGFELGLDHWDTTNVTLSNDAHTGTQAALIGAAGSLVPDASIPVSEGDVWDVSAYAKNGSALVVDVLNAADNTVLESFTTSTASSWSETGRLRVEVPAGVSYVNIRITGDGVLVDDVVLRDVTDVVRLERAATAARQTAEQAISELEVMRLAVDGEGGLKDRLTTAETTLETKADEAVVDNVAAGLAGLSGLNTRTYIQDDEPPTPSGAVTYEWEGEPHESPSIKRDHTGQVVARNLAVNPSFETGYSGWPAGNAGTDVITVAKDSWLPMDDSGERMLRISPNESASTSAYSRASGDMVIDVAPGDWVAIRANVAVRNPSDVTARVSGQITVDGNTYGPMIPASFQPVAPEGETRTVVGQMPTGASAVRIISWLSANGSGFLANDALFVDAVMISVADSEEAALAQVETYFDGDTPDAPAETGLWLRGEDKFWFDHTTKQWVQVTDTGAFARLITNELFANLGVFDRLQAREGWIGGTLLADGAITAEKIHATRELITKIMGAEWAYIAQQLIVDGKILTRDLEALSAAIQSLTVTQRADIAQLWAEELWAALGVFNKLQAEEAWITSAMISELTAEKVTVTENFVGRVAELLHLVVDQIDANSLWADQTWQNAGHFGGTEGTYQTHVDGQGLSVWRQVEGEQQLATRLGPGENALSFFDEDTGQLTGSLSQDGSANLQETAVQSLNIAGRDLTHAPHEYQPGVPLLDSMPRGVWVAGPVDMSGVSVDRSRYGFLELTANVVEGRVYRLSTSNFLMDVGASYYGAFRYTISPDGNQVPTVNSPDLVRWIMTYSGAANVQEGGRAIFVAPQTGVLRVLLCVERSGSSTGITFNALSSWAGNVQMWLEDLGTNKHAVSRRRFSGIGGAQPDFLDDTPGVQTYRTEWAATWYQNYTNGGVQQRPSGVDYGINALAQGYNPRLNEFGYWTSLAGFDGATASSHASEQGLSFQAALAGADIQSVQIEVTGAGSLGPDPRFFPAIHWAPNTTVPNQYLNAPARMMATPRVDPGWTKLVDIPEQYWPLLQTGDFQATGFSNASPDLIQRDGWLAWGNQRPRVIVTYQK